MTSWWTALVAAVKKEKRLKWQYEVKNLCHIYGQGTAFEQHALKDVDLDHSETGSLSA